MPNDKQQPTERAEQPAREEPRVGVFRPPPAPVDGDAAKRAADRDGTWSARPPGQSARRRYPYSITD